MDMQYVATLLREKKVQDLAYVKKLQYFKKI